MNTNPTVILNGDQIYCDELIRENARLTVQHEADRQKITDLQQRLEEQGAEIIGRDAAEVTAINDLLTRAVADLHTVMAGGDPCAVCAKKCMMGEGNCQPVWRGEESDT